MAKQNKRPLGEIFGGNRRQTGPTTARSLADIFGKQQDNRQDTVALSPADSGFWNPSDPWEGPEQEREPGRTPNFRGEKKLAFLEQSQRMMDGWQGEQAAESMPAPETVGTLQTEAVAAPADKTEQRMPVERFDVRGVLNQPAVRSGVLADPQPEGVPAPGDKVLPSGSVLRRSDQDLNDFFREQVAPGIDAVQAEADERAGKALTEQGEARDRRWLEHFNIDPVGDYVAEAVQTEATDRKLRGPARIVEDVLSKIDPGKVKFYIADHLADDPEFAAAADRLRQVVPAAEEVSEQDVKQMLAALSPAQRRQYDKAVAEEQKRIAGEQEAFQKAVDAAWKRQAQRFQQGITGQLVEEMARRNMPQTELKALGRIAYNASVPGMLTEWAVGNATGADKALHAQIMQRAMEKYDPSIATRIGGEVAGLLLSGPVFAAGGALGRAGAAGLRRIAERSVMKRLMARGITEGAEGVARRLVARNTAQQLAQAAVASGTTLGTYDAVATPLAMAAAGEGPGFVDVLGAAGRGFATGALLPGIGMATGRVADAATSRLGRYAAEAGGFAAENAAFVGMGTLYDGLRTGEWGSPEQLAEDFGHSVGVLGIMKSVGALKRGRTKNPGFYDKVIAETEFTPEEVDALGRAGVDGRSYKRAVFDLLNAKETAAGREVAERAAEQLGSRYADVMQSPEVPVSAKAKLMYLVEGRIPERLPLTTDVRRTVGEDGRTTVDLFDPAGNLVQRRTFATEKAAEAFERESAGVREVNGIQYYGTLIDRMQSLDEAAQAVAAERGVAVEAVKTGLRDAAEGRPHDRELVRRVAELAGNGNAGGMDIPGLLAGEVARKYALGENGMERALALKEADRTPGQREAVAEYAARLKEIATQELRPEPTPEQRAERQLMEVADRAIEQTKNRDDGVIYTATMQDGRQANIIKGASLVYDPETGEVDAAQSDPTVIVRYEDGEMRQVSVREIDMIEEAVSTDDARAEVLKAIREQLDAAAREQALTDAADRGGMVELKDGRIGVVEGMNEDGSFNVAVQDAEGRIVTGQVAAGDIAGPVAEEQVREAAPTSEVAEAEPEVPGVQEQASAAAPEVPRLKNGQPDFNAMPADMLAVELSAVVGHDKAVERLQVARGVNARNMEKLRKALDGMGDLNKAMAVEQRIAAMQQEDARMAGALEQLGAAEASAVAETPAGTFTQEIDRLFPDGLPNVRARVLADIARGQRFVWNDSPDGVKRGVATELGFAGNESERRARFGMLGSEATGAKHVSRYVHDLWQDSNGYAFDMDDAALRDEVIDVLLATPSRASAMEQLRDMAARVTEDATAPRDVEDLAAMQEYEKQLKTLSKPENNGNFAERAYPETYETATEKFGRDNDEPAVASGNDGSRLVGDATGRVAGIGDRSDIRVFEEGLAASYREHSDGSERDRREAESERLVAVAKENGLYIDEKQLSQFGDKQPGKTGESVVHVNRLNGKVYKSKNPYAKAAIKGNAPEDAIYEHLIHNLLFPETRYTFEGISDHLGDVRIVLSQNFIESVGQPTKGQIDAALAARGLLPEDKYRYGNDLVSVTDVEGDNVLTGNDGRLYFIDPIIRLKKPAREVIDELSAARPNSDRDSEPEIGLDDVPFSVIGEASVAPAGVTPERWKVIVDQLRRVIGAENVVTDPAAVREAYDRITGRGMEIRRRQVAEANERFNAQLDLFEGGTLPSDEKLVIGRPCPVLLASGVDGSELYITQSVLRDHMAKHGLSAGDLKNLPEALEHPIMVYEWGSKAKSIVIITAIPRGNERIAVAVRLKTIKDGIKINKIASIHGKSAERLLADMNTPLTDFGAENLKWVDKEKVLDWMSMEAPLASSASDQGLVTAVKIVTNFENPKIGPENMVLQSDETRYFRTPEGEVYGFTVGGKIYLDSERMNAVTPMHEYTELWSQIVARENPELWMRGVELMKQTFVWDEVNADPNYKELPEELRVSETLSRMVADEFAGKQDAITDSSVLLGKLRAWMRKFWGFLKGTFAKWTKRELDDLTPKKFAQMPLRDFVEGIDLQKVRGPKPEQQRVAGHKQMQLEIIERYNPMRDDVHTGIRNIEDIKTFEEVVNEAKSEDDTAYPDIGLDLLEKAAKTGRITVYSSYPIKQGVFVSPSRMNAADYAGDGPIYSKEVSVNDVAWITSDEGQYAKVGNNPEARFSFIGELGAENLDKAEEASVRLDNLAAARSMETAGKDALAIKMATGWERGTDGKWRYEIPDIKVIRQPEMTVSRTEEGDVWYKTKLGELIDAPELFTAYPQLANIEVGIQTLPKGESGSYHNNVLILNIDTYKDKKEDVKKRIGEIERSAEYKEYSNVFDAEDATEAEMNTAMKKFFDSDIGKEYYELMWGKGSTEKAFGKSARSVLVHEIQHAIQNIEGFAKGGNLIIGERISKQRDSLTDWQRNLSPGEAYFNIAGEVEARNVQKRLGMSIEERLASLAEETEDVTRKDQIVLREALGGGSASLANARELTERRVTTLEKLENKRDALVAGRGNIANFDERLAAVDAEIEAYGRVDHVAGTYGKNGADAESDAHLQAVEDAVYDIQRILNIGDNQITVARNTDEYVSVCEALGHTRADVIDSEGKVAQGFCSGNEIVIYAGAMKNRHKVLEIVLHERTHFLTNTLMANAELYEAGVRIGAEYINRTLRKRSVSYVVDPENPDSVAEGVGEMISRDIEILTRDDLMGDYLADEALTTEPMAQYMKAHNVPEALAALVLEQSENIKADLYGKQRTRNPRAIRENRTETGRARSVDRTFGEGREWQSNRTRTVQLHRDGVDEGIFRGRNDRSGSPEEGGRNDGDITPRIDASFAEEPAPKLTKQQQLIADLRRAVRESKASARAVAQIVSRRVRREVGADLVEIMGKRDFDALIRQIEEATARQEVEKPLQRIAEVVTDLEIKRLQKVVDDFLKLKVQGEGPRGVSVAKEVDDRTRRMFEIFRNNLDRPAAEVAGELREQEDADTLYDLDAVSALEAYQEAVRYGREADEIDREVEEMRARNTQLRRERIAVNKVGHKVLFESLKKQILYNNELIDALEAERVETKGHRAGALKETAGLLSGQIGAGREILSEWKEQEQERRKKIVKEAFRDVDDGTKIPVLDKRPGVWTQGYRRTVEFLLSPAYSMDYLLKTISVNAPKGEGALYDHFMRSADGYVEARGRYYLGYEDFKKVLDEKARAVFGKSYPEVVADSNAPTAATITITNAAPRRRLEQDKQKETDAGNQEMAAVEEVYNPTIGEALYIYMANKMTDGRVKLKRMGIKEVDVDALAGILPVRFVQFAEWLQNEFLPERRKTYNATHLAVFGTQMARIENYVPLKIQKSYVRQEVDGSEPDPDTLPSAITGSIIKRTRNNQILNLHTNALDLMLEHGQQMEHWNAFTRIVLDMNALLTSTAFRRMLDTRNPGLHKRLKVAAQLAADSYRPQANDVNRAWIALGKLAASSKIAFRVNTALKQVLSYPAFYAYSPNPKFWTLLTKNLAPTTWAKNFRWCIDNIPSFRERWLGRMAGNEKLAQMTAPALDRWLDKMNKYGMVPNAFVDALTCANGAMAVYDFRRAEYMERGRDKAEAERLARIDAAVSINATQQSSEGMYIGQMQADRDFWSVSLSTFQNSNFAYLRKQLEGIDELFRDTMRERRNRTAYYKEQGFSEDEAFDRALKEVTEAKRGALLNIGVFVFGLNILWGLGNNVWKYLFASETRDEIPGELAKSALMAPIRNTTVGSIAESFANGYDANPSVLLSDMVAFTKRLRRIVEKENPDAWNETAAYLALQTISANGLGIDLESFVNMCQGIAGMIRDGVDAEDLMRMLNAPQSQAKLLAGQPREGESAEEYRDRMIFTERRIAGRLNKSRLDKWSRNYIAYRQAEALELEAVRDKFGSVTIPEMKQLDAEYGSALKQSGLTAAGDMRKDYDWQALTSEQQERWRRRARLVWKIHEQEQQTDTVIVYNESYAQRMRRLLELKKELINGVKTEK